MARRARIGLVGLGLVGKALAARLLHAGHVVSGFDIDADARAAARGLGVLIVENAAAAARDADLLLLSLPDAAAVNDVLWDEGRLAEACRAGMTILDTTTTAPEDTLAHHDALARRDTRFIDVTLVGSSREIAAGEAVALIGDAESDADYSPLVETFTRRRFYLGGPGQGNRAKLVVNLVLGLNRLVLAEGLALAERAGMDRAQALDILRDSAARSAVMDTKGPRMVSGDFEPVARLAQHAKDVGLIRAMAQAAGAYTPLSDLHESLLHEAMDRGWGSLDNAAVIRLYRERL